jgi:hypothetical protein
MTLVISKPVQVKLKFKHDVNVQEVRQCFINRDGFLLEDSREQHRSDPPTQWFISQTDKGRTLKIVFVAKNGSIHLKSAFEPNEIELDIYNRFGKRPRGALT